MQKDRNEVPSWIPVKSRELMSRIANSLTELGYTESATLWDAARRMALAPALVEDMFAYISAGRPKLEGGTQIPRTLSRPLPGNYTVASLMKDLDLEPAGAFLLAAELVSNTPKALEAIVQIIEEGYCRRLPEGVTAIVHPPASAKYPSCPNCGRRWTRKYESCPTCGYDEECIMIDSGQIPQDLREAIMQGMTKGKTGTTPAKCNSCGSALRPGAKFCESCGAPVPAVQPPQELKSPVYCEMCGAKIKEGARFCESCGAPVAGAGAKAGK